MNGFLRGLLERGIHPMERVRPRVPGIFEPEKAGFETRVWEPAVTVETVVNPTAPNRRTRRQENDFGPKFRELEAEEQGALERAPARENARRVYRAPHTAASAEVRDRPDPHEDHAEESHATLSEPGQKMLVSREPLRTQATGQEPAAGPKREWEKRVGANTDASIGKSHSPMNTDTSVRDREPSQHAAAKRLISVERTAEPVRGDSEELAARRIREKLVEPPSRFAAVRAEGEPTIHISIGRVEVRAVQESSAAARESRKSSPVMSLDEYLQQRAAKGAGR